jgi:hypothetical protein
MRNVRIESPVPGPVVRDDKWGKGHFGSPRGSKAHDGLDLVVVPGQPVFSMIEGVVEKYEQCYRSDPRWTGIQIANTQLRVELWYMEPLHIKVNQFVRAGELLGAAQNISTKYPPTPKIPYPMTPHIHVRVTLRAFTTINNRRWVAYEQYMDPALLLGV